MVSYTVGDDFKVSRRYRVDIVRLAAQWRAANPNSAISNSFDVVGLLRDHVLPTLLRHGRQIALRIVDDDWALHDGWVDWNNGEVCFQNGVWEQAIAGEAHGRLVVAHEMGHLLLHKEEDFSFSKGLEKKLDFLDPEDSAEQQANWFAAALLLPDAVVRRLSRLDVYSVATLTLAGEHVVRVRRRDLAMEKHHFTGDECPRCNSMTVVQEGIVATCITCGTELGSC